MKVILTTHVDNLGAPGDVVDVANGYARNYLIPRGMADKATQANLNLWQTRAAAVLEQDEKQISEARERAATIDGRELNFTARAGEKGQLFGSVTSGDIAGRLGVERKQVILADPIKALGSVDVEIRLHPQVSAMVKIHVASEDEESEKEEE